GGCEITARRKQCYGHCCGDLRAGAVRSHGRPVCVLAVRGGVAANDGASPGVAFVGCTSCPASSPDGGLFTSLSLAEIPLVTWMSCPRLYPSVTLRNCTRFPASTTATWLPSAPKIRACSGMVTIVGSLGTWKCTSTYVPGQSLPS